MTFASALLAFVLMNLVTVAAFATDKRRAIRREWRIAESTLLGLALVGGSAGAIWARRRFRHKTRKQPFSAMLDGIAMLHAGLTFGLVIAFLL